MENRRFKPIKSAMHSPSGGGLVQLSNFSNPRSDVNEAAKARRTQSISIKRRHLSSDNESDEDNEFASLYGSDFSLTDRLFGFLTSSPKEVAKKNTEKTFNYNAVRDVTTAKFLGLLEKIDAWQKIKVVDGITIYKNQSDGLTLCAQIGIDDIREIELDAMVSRLKNSSFSSHPFVQAICPIEKYEENCKAVHITFYNVARSPSDDFCLLSSYAKLKPGCYLVSGHSINHVACPKRPAYNRGEVLLFGYYIEWSETSSRAIVTYLNQFSAVNLSDSEIEKISGVECFSLVSSIKEVIG